MSTSELTDPTRRYHALRDALKEEQATAFAALRERQAAEQAEFEAAWNIRWRELQELVGFRK
jgi:hypothetical protein